MTDEVTENARTPRRGSNMIITGPVRDWATDFSHLEPEWTANPYPIQDDLRQRCPIAHTERFGGAWLPTRYEDVVAIAHDTERFSSRSIIVATGRPAKELAPVGAAPPGSSDPPAHHASRKLLLPAFTKAAAARYEPSTRAYCHSLIDAFQGTIVDGAQDFAQHIPGRLMAELLGFPPEDESLFAAFVRNTNETADYPPRTVLKHTQELMAYVNSQIEDHVADPRDDLTTYLLNAQLNGRELDRSYVANTLKVLLLAGMDTSWSAIGASLWHLATTPKDRERLVAEPELLPIAVEELLRAYAPFATARLVKEDMNWHGLDMKAEDWVMLTYPAANRDPAQFDRADEVIIDREVNQHAAFGLGIHRCLGAHLARMELRVALEVWLERLPIFTLADPAAVEWSVGQVRGPRTLPLRTRG